MFESHRLYCEVYWCPQIFIRPSLDGTYYGMVPSVRLSVRPLAPKNIEGISGLFSNSVYRCA